MLFIIKRKRSQKCKNSKEDVIRKIDFGYSLSNVESSMLSSLHNRSLSENQSNLDEEQQSLIDINPPSSLVNSQSLLHLPKFYQTNLMFLKSDSNDNLEAEINLDTIDLMTNENSSCCFVPPPSPINNYLKDELQSDEHFGEHQNNEFQREKDDLLINYNNNYCNNSLFDPNDYQIENPPNSPSNSINDFFN